MAYIYNLADNWVDAGVTYTSFKMSVTDSASNAASLLMDLQVGGVSKFKVAKNSTLAVETITANGSYYLSMQNAINANGYWASATDGALGTNGAGFALAANRDFAWTATASNAALAVDLRLFRDAANTLAQRNGVNAQTSRIYNTYTDASNYERGKFAWSSNVLQIGTEKAGTGTARALQFQTDGTTRLTIATNAGSAQFGQGSMGQFAWYNAYNNIVFEAWESSTIKRFLLNSILLFDGTTSSFPSLKRDTVRLQVRLADDSAFTNIQGKLTTETAYTAGAPTATGYIVLYDSAGTAYKVPAVAL